MNTNILEKDANRFIARRLEMAVGVRAEDYGSLPGPSNIEPRVRADSQMWSEHFFTPRADPHKMTPRPKLGFHVDRDLLRYEYSLEQMPVVIVEGATFTIVRFVQQDTARFLKMNAADRLAEVGRLCATMLNVYDGWKPRAPAAKAEAVGFSTNPGVSLTSMSSWDRRVEAGVYKNELYVLCHKKYGHLVGFGSEKWFSDAFRTQHAASPGSNRTGGAR